jgi:hypothetical protein
METEVRIMNVARKIYLIDTAYENRWNRISDRPSGADIIALVSRRKREDKKATDGMTIEYLNEKLAYFYNHGGPIMEL